MANRRTGGYAVIYNYCLMVHYIRTARCCINESSAKLIGALCKLFLPACIFILSAYIVLQEYVQ